MNWQTARTAVTLVELIVVLAIIAGMCALLFPAVQSARESSRVATCQNNLRQLSLAMRGYVEAYQRAPAKPAVNMAGGWAIAILPFMEENDLADQFTANPALTSPAIQRLAPLQPILMRCPSAFDGESNVPTAPVSSYVLSTNSSRETWWLGDAPTDLRTAWLISPEIQFNDWSRAPGPHHQGFFLVSTDAHVGFRDFKP